MKIQFFGAAREVTGSRHLLKVNGKQIFLDFGLAQGRRKETDKKNRILPVNPKKIDAVLLSHAHIDHSGNLPTLVKEGFRGPIYATHATRDLCNYMLLDSAFIQEKEFEYLQKKHAKKKSRSASAKNSAQNRGPIEPLYDMDDARQAINQFVGMSYDRPFEIVPGVVASFRDAGHILGSSIITLVIDDRDTGKQILLTYTGDLGRKGLPILRNPEKIERSDILIMESTYGNRFHAALQEVDGQLEKIVKDTCKKGGKIIIPAFAVERTQEIVYHLNLLFQAKKIPEIPIFVDSPLAVNVTSVFTSHPECFDKETWHEFLKNQKNPFGFGRLKYVTDAEDSKALNGMRGPMIIISAAGMCENGRILHHLRNNIENPKNTILLVGYMAKDTLGRKILEKQPIVKIFGDEFRLKANVVVMDAFSAHADRSDLLDFVSYIKGLKKIFLVHGEEEQGLTFANVLKEKGYREIFVPHPGEEFEV